jgi:hypothetical protein
LVHQFTDYEIGRAVGFEIFPVFGGFEGDHGISPRIVGTKKPAEP